MQIHTKREFLSAAQYLLIGIIAEGVALTWFIHRSPLTQIIVWVVVAGVLSFVRLIILYFSEWMLGEQWRTIRRRNWDSSRD